MANVLSKMKYALSLPMKKYEERQNRKLYKKVYNNSIDELCENCQRCNCNTMSPDNLL